jgi:hypothetical protein
MQHLLFCLRFYLYESDVFFHREIARKAIEMYIPVDHLSTEIHISIIRPEIDWLFISNLMSGFSSLLLDAICQTFSWVSSPGKCEASVV